VGDDRCRPGSASVSGALILRELEAVRVVAAAAQVDEDEPTHALRMCHGRSPGSSHPRGKEGAPEAAVWRLSPLSCVGGAAVATEDLQVSHATIWVPSGPLERLDAAAGRVFAYGDERCRARLLGGEIIGGMFLQGKDAMNAGANISVPCRRVRASLERRARE